MSKFKRTLTKNDLELATAYMELTAGLITVVGFWTLSYSTGVVIGNKMIVPPIRKIHSIKSKK